MRGGRRVGAGKPRGLTSLTVSVSTRYSEAEIAQIEAQLMPGETVRSFIRRAALAVAMSPVTIARFDGGRPPKIDVEIIVPASADAQAPIRRP